MVERSVFLHEKNDMFDVFQRTRGDSTRKEYRDDKIRMPRHFQFIRRTTVKAQI